MSQDLLQTSSRMTELEPGTLIEGKYRIVRYLAGGGMGSIYQAVQEPLGRDVALKLLKPREDDEVDEATRQRRFFREASIASQLNHPNTVTIYDYGQLSAQDGFFLVMEYLDGGTLRDYLNQHQPLDAATAIVIASQIAESLADAHEHGVVHRDLKPPNVMLVRRGGNDLFVKVVDFGLVKQVNRPAGSEELTQEDALLGSPLYMAPERIMEQNADGPGADIYAFGVMLYEMLVGRPPFIREGDATIHHVVIQHVQAPVPPMRTLNPALDLPDGLEEIVMRCLEKNPQDRFHSMEELAIVLRAYLSSSGEFSSFTPSGGLRRTAAANAMGSTAHSTEFLVEQTPDPGAYQSSEAFSRDFPSGMLPRAEQQTEQAPTRRSPVPMIVGGVIAIALIAAAGFAAMSSKGGAPNLHITSTPSGASVYAAGRLIGHTPLDVRVDQLGASQLIIKDSGFEEFVYHVPRSLREDREVTAALKKLAEPPPKEKAPEVKQPAVAKGAADTTPEVKPDAAPEKSPEKTTPEKQAKSAVAKKKRRRWRPKKKKTAPQKETAPSLGIKMTR